MRARVFLADDHSLLLEAISTLLERSHDVVGTAMDGREMLTKVRKLKPDVVVLDIAMPGLNGLGAGEKLKKLLPDVKLIFLTGNNDAEMATEAFRIGANGYLLKSSAATELFQAIDVALRGGKYVTPEISNDLINAFIRNPSGERTQGSLSLRQREVLQLLAEGKTMKEVSKILHISASTVAFHKYQIMDDLDIKTNSELIHYAITHGLIS